MTLGVIGTKCGMTRIFTENGESIPVTVIEVLPNRITDIKTAGRDGYRAVQVTTGKQHQNRVNKPRAGIYAKAGVDAGRGLWEFRLTEDEGGDLEVGGEFNAGIFTAGQKVDVKGTSIGKGYAGVIKRHHFKSGDATHGNSLAHRLPGSIGQCQSPGKVFKGKRMSGHLGNAQRTVRNLSVVRVDTERNIILVKGAVPGAKGGNLSIHPSTKGS